MVTMMMLTIWLTFKEKCPVLRVNEEQRRDLGIMFRAYAVARSSGSGDRPALQILTYTIFFGMPSERKDLGF